MSAIFFAVCVGLAVSQLALFLTTVYLHRALAHRALKLRPWLAAVCRVALWITTGIKPRQWVAVHRKHHAFTDVPGDPHSPVLRGYAAVQFGNVGMYRAVANDKPTVARYARDLPADRWDRLLFDHALLGLGLGIGFLCLVLGWRLGLVASAVHMVSYLMINAAVNAVGHRFGTRPRAGFATNSQWLAWLAAGEGLHNNHHAAPTSAHLALARGEIDPAWWAIRTGQRFGWLTIRHEQPKLVPHDRSREKGDKREKLAA
ncbi:MAG: fatty acid desaturase [Actinomycetota bacterium]|nr:fatty acid desaturase [Actinomycetota bacterium]